MVNPVPLNVKNVGKHERHFVISLVIQVVLLNFTKIICKFLTCSKYCTFLQNHYFAVQNVAFRLIQYVYCVSQYFLHLKEPDSQFLQLFFVKK